MCVCLRGGNVQVSDKAKSIEENIRESYGKASPIMTEGCCVGVIYYVCIVSKNIGKLYDEFGLV